MIIPSIFVTDFQLALPLNRGSPFTVLLLLQVKLFFEAIGTLEDKGETADDWKHKLLKGLCSYK